MRLCGLDLETTGLNHETDQVTEIAWVIKDVGDPKPIVAKTYFVTPPGLNGGEIPDDYIRPEIAQLTRIQKKHLAYGRTLSTVLGRLAHDIKQYKVDAIVAHNGENFDRPFLRAKAEGCNQADIDTVFNCTWADSSIDCVYPADCRSTSLLYLAAYHGFLNPFPHSALFDVTTMLRICDSQDMEKVLARAKEPWVTVQACTSYDQRHLAKARRYTWENLGSQHFPRSWVKRLKESEVAKEKAEAGFPVVVL